MKPWRCLFAFLAAGILITGASAADASDTDKTISLTYGASVRASGSIGDSFFIEQRISVPEVFRDASVSVVLSSGLTLREKAKVYTEGNALSSSLYTVSTTDASGQTVMGIHFSSMAAETLRSSPELFVIFSVTINDNAGTGEVGSRIGIKLKTSCGVETVGEVCFPSASLVLFRGFQSADGSVRPAEGCCFMLCRAEDNEGLVFAPTGYTTFRLCKAASCTHKRHMSILRTKSNGVITLEGLPCGEYNLREEHPAKGITAYSGSIRVMVDEEGEVTVDGQKTEDGAMRIVTASGRETVNDVTEGPFYRRGIVIMLMIDLIALATHKRRMKAIG